MKEKMKLIIIGTGPAGLMCGASLQNKIRENILMLEKNEEAGKKLLISGSGQCNFTHTGSNNEFLKHYFEAENFLKHSIYNFSNKNTMEFFQKNCGIEILIRDDGKVFPASLNALDIRNALLDRCLRNKVVIKYNEPVLQISKSEDYFTVTTSKNIYQSEKVLIATGGKSYPQTGSTGDGFSIASKLGHTIVTPKPALPPLVIDDLSKNDLSGISFYNKRVSLSKEEKKFCTLTGDFLFTHKGLSGPVILAISRYAEKGDMILLSFLEYNNEDDFKNFFMETIKQNPNKAIKSIMHSFDIPKKLITMILDRLNIQEDTKSRDLSKKAINQIVTHLLYFPLMIKNVCGFNSAMVTKGGVSLKEVNPKTMESRLIKGLYFAGEVLNIDGETGGYNIQAAFSTGFTSGKSIFD